MNWNNVNLSGASERSLNILDNYSFDALLLEISCNLKEINEKTVKEQAVESIKAKYREALEILDANMSNIVKHAKAERNDYMLSRSELLNTYGNELIQNGFKIIKPMDTGTYFFFEKDGNIGYVQEERFVGLRFSTVHKPNKETGTGFSMNEYGKGIFEPTIEHALETFCIAPDWATKKQRESVVKYYGISKFIASKFNKYEIIG